jgi:hypothetical protein
MYMPYMSVPHVPAPPALSPTSKMKQPFGLKQEHLALESCYRQPRMFINFLVSWHAVTSSEAIAFWAKAKKKQPFGLKEHLALESCYRQPGMFINSHVSWPALTSSEAIAFSRKHLWKQTFHMHMTSCQTAMNILIFFITVLCKP